MPISKKREIKGKGRAARKQQEPDFDNIFRDVKKSKNIPNISCVRDVSPNRSILVKESRLKKPLTEKEMKEKKRMKKKKEFENKKVKFDLNQSQTKEIPSIKQMIEMEKLYQQMDEDEPYINIKIPEPAIKSINQNLVKKRFKTPKNKKFGKVLQPLQVSETTSQDSPSETILPDLDKLKDDGLNQLVKPAAKKPLKHPNLGQSIKIKHTDEVKNHDNRESTPNEDEEFERQELEEQKAKIAELERVPSTNNFQDEKSMVLYDKPLLHNKKSHDDFDDQQLNESTANLDGLGEFDQDVQRIEMNMVDLNDIKNKIEDVINVLGNFKMLKDQISKPRKFFLLLLIHLLAKLYGYNRWLMARFVRLIPLPELLEFLDWNEKERPLTLRANTLKISASDLLTLLKKKRGGVLKCDRLKVFDNNNQADNSNPEKTKQSPAPTVSRRSDLIIIYESQFSLGATPEYLAGLYTIQGTASYLAGVVLYPQPGERILDLCAAPGGKTCHIAAMMKNKGVIFANDANFDRAKSIASNYHRLGISNVIVTNYDGREYPKVMLGFNRALVDAPCMGTGVISKDPSVKMNKDEKSLRKTTRMQRELLLAAIDCVDARNGGVIVYSTCSLLVDENELVIDYATRKRNVKIVPTGLDIGSEAFVKFREHRFHPDMRHCRRFYPHIHNTDGFFIAKLQKIYQKVEKEEHGQEGSDHENKLKKVKRKFKDKDSLKGNKKIKKGHKGGLKKGAESNGPSDSANKNIKPGGPKIIIKTRKRKQKSGTKAPKSVKKRALLKKSSNKFKRNSKKKKGNRTTNI